MLSSHDARAIGPATMNLVLEGLVRCRRPGPLLRIDDNHPEVAAVTSERKRELSEMRERLTRLMLLMSRADKNMVSKHTLVM